MSEKVLFNLEFGRNGASSGTVFPNQETQEVLTFIPEQPRQDNSSSPAYYKFNIVVTKYNGKDQDGQNVYKNFANIEVRIYNPAIADYFKKMAKGGDRYIFIGNIGCYNFHEQKITQTSQTTGNQYTVITAGYIKCILNNFDFKIIPVGSKQQTQEPEQNNPTEQQRVIQDENIVVDDDIPF